MFLFSQYLWAIILSWQKKWNTAWCVIGKMWRPVSGQDTHISGITYHELRITSHASPVSTI